MVGIGTGFDKNMIKSLLEFYHYARAGMKKLVEQGKIDPLIAARTERLEGQQYLEILMNQHEDVALTGVVQATIQNLVFMYRIMESYVKKNIDKGMNPGKAYTFAEKQTDQYISDYILGTVENTHKQVYGDPTENGLVELIKENNLF